jgi:transcriptional regulator with XRE-family HTH domain
MTHMQQETPPGVELVDVDAETGIIVQSLMFRRRMKQQDLAAALGTSQANVSRKLRGLTVFSPTDLVKLARLLEVDAGELLPRLDSNQQPFGYRSGQGIHGPLGAYPMWDREIDRLIGLVRDGTYSAWHGWALWCKWDDMTPRQRGLVPIGDAR